MEGVVYADSSAAIGVVKRKGSGKLRHVRIGKLWIQEKRERGEVHYRKVLGTRNPADLFTKGLTEKMIDTHMSTINQMKGDGRAESSLRL